MANEFKQCPNGHYYQGDSCPYCRTTTNGANTSLKTEGFMGGGGNSDDVETVLDPTIKSAKAGTRTEIIDQTNYQPGSRSINTPINRTVFGDDSDETSSHSHGDHPAYRTTRKLVGWLVSYSFDEMGVDYKLFEGRNIIGRDESCNITVNDGMMSANHAVLLFRAGRYSLSDSQSSHGTFVNGQDIDLNPTYISDGDIIRMGETEFKFRTSF